jgi:phage baseplate assembly protein W
MGYTIIQATDSILLSNQLSNANISTNTTSGVDVRLSGNGSFQILRSSYNLTIAYLKNLLLTKKGERYGFPEFGTNLLNILFEPAGDNIKELITDTISEAISTYIPEIDLDAIDIVTQYDDPNLIHEIRITVKFSVNGQDNVLSFNLDPNGLIIIEEQNGN